MLGAPPPRTKGSLASSTGATVLLTADLDASSTTTEPPVSLVVPSSVYQGPRAHDNDLRRPLIDNQDFRVTTVRPSLHGQPHGSRTLFQEDCDTASRPPTRASAEQHTHPSTLAECDMHGGRRDGRAACQHDTTTGPMFPSAGPITNNTSRVMDPPQTRRRPPKSWRRPGTTCPCSRMMSVVFLLHRQDLLDDEDQHEARQPALRCQQLRRAGMIYIHALPVVPGAGRSVL